MSVFKGRGRRGALAAAGVRVVVVRAEALIGRLEHGVFP